MKYVIYLVMLFALVACGTASNGNGSDETPTSTDQNQMIGYVSKFENNRVLVTENYIASQTEEIPIEELYEQAGNAIFFNLENIDKEVRDSLAIGEKITVTHGPIAESYPAQSSATDIARVKDSDHDLIETHGEYENLIHLETFRQAVQNQQVSHLRLIRHTTEGDPIYYNISYDGNEFNISRDSRKDSYAGSGDIMNGFTCKQLENSLTEENNIRFDFTSCDQQEKLSFEVPYVEIMVPKQTYQSLEIIVGDQKILESDDKEKINKVIEKIRTGTPKSVMIMTKMAPAGELVLKGEQANIRFDFYKDGNLIRYNTFIEAGITVD
ncbi:DUF4362 domain-containing protein [Gracilibacillus caseinilyticus]|uniref:DUF4362 domain-containing protein n=1 Tax=Gracilibacillus caseinilyticus TaxID=2932256 RepID=A0ABY4ET14_9BACI|nr:DUF4362 domain-containing protein [Gracilibacillus caseinilyticus]UOQ47013.1 DUF4362 domain-containing protein [Gracilibacillus caseinilyticus]